MRSKLACLVIVAALAACNGKSSQSSGGPPSSLPAAGKGPQSGSRSTEPGNKVTVTGKVTETMDSGGYTYLRMEWSGKERWVAVPQAKVQVGDTVTVYNGVEMQTFTSKTLNRTFERILFGTLSQGAAGAMPPGHPPVAGSQPAGPAPAHPPVAPPPKIADLKVPKAAGADGRTVAAVFADAATLKDKPVVINAVVVKLNTGIMNKNWVHLQDGTGSAEKKDNDLVATTTDTVKVGDKVQVKGTVRQDKDFGFGYKYATLLEDAKLAPLK
jgi:hypothetical protein